MSRTLTVACLSGDGLGPELMAEASRVLAEVARMHSLHIAELHLPFGGEALTRFGHPLPLSTREAYRKADAILVTSPSEPALDGVKADLDLAWRISRVHGARVDLLVVGPVGRYSDELAVARAFELAAARRGRLASIGSTDGWHELVAVEEDRWDGLRVDRPTVGEALALLRDEPEALDVVVVDAHLAAGLGDAAVHLADTIGTLATAWLSERGPGVFSAHACDDAEVAGLGVADPAGTLLATALLLSEGLHLRSAARTLERAVKAAEAALPHERDTRRFTDTVIEALPDARTDTELFEEVWR